MNSQCATLLITHLPSQIWEQLNESSLISFYDVIKHVRLLCDKTDFRFPIRIDHSKFVMQIRSWKWKGTIGWNWKVLQPLSHRIDNLILDSPHLLLLLQNLKLDPNRKYILITADINSMHLELLNCVCKNNCLAFYEKYKHVTQFPIEMSTQKLKQLLNLSLDYSYVEFDNELFCQTKGIQIGN